jgi:hypothetical protein
MVEVSNWTGRGGILTFLAVMQSQSYALLFDALEGQAYGGISEMLHTRYRDHQPSAKNLSQLRDRKQLNCESMQQFIVSIEQMARTTPVGLPEHYIQSKHTFDVDVEER